MYPLGNEAVFSAVSPSLENSSAVDNLIQSMLNSVVKIVVGFALLGAGVIVITKLLAECTLATTV